jgi:chemosensory pili system protein ChpA (sensor histidine kinase/response regulator)
MSAVPESDIGPLVWVKSEIDLACARAGEALESFSSGGDHAQIKFAATHLHQAQGALAIVGLDGATLLAQTLEKLVVECEHGQLAPSHERLSLVQQGLSFLRHYLDELANGQPDQPFRLLPIYLDLQRARGIEGAGPADLFFPDLSRRPPRRPADFVAPAPEQVPRMLRRERARFQRGLLQFLRHGKGVADMRQAIAAVESCQTLPAARTFWWAAGGFFDVLADGKADTAAKRLCGRIDGQLRRLISGSPNVSERLMRDVLYQVAVTPGGRAIAHGVRDSFALGGLTPETEGKATVAPPMLRDVREAVLATKEDWERFCAGTAISLPQLDEDTARLDAQAVRLNHPMILSLASAVRAVALWLRKDPLRQSESVGMEVATTLLLLENALDNFERLDESFMPQADMMVARLAAILKGEAPGVLEAPLLDEMSRKAQERLVMRQVVREIQNNLNQIEQALDGFFRDPVKRDALEGLAVPIKQVEGALYILGQERAVSVLHQCAGLIAGFAEGEGDDAQFEEVADKLSALGFFVASLPYGTADVDALLGRDLGEDREQAEAEGEEESVEQQLEQQKRWAQSLADALEEAPEDQYLRDRLHKNLETLRQDANLAGDAQLEQRADHALQQLAATSTGGEAYSKTSLGELAPAEPVLSEKTARLAESDREEIDAELLAIFLEEAKEVLDTIGENLGRSRSNPHDHDVLTTIRRAFHTLKGSGRMVNLKELGEVAWSVEQVMNRWLQAEKDATDALHGLLADAHEVFSRWVEQLDAGGSTHMDAQELVALAESLMAGDTPARPATPLAAPPAPVVVEALPPAVEELPTQPEALFAEPVAVEQPAEIEESAEAIEALEMLEPEEVSEAFALEELSEDLASSEEVEQAAPAVQEMPAEAPVEELPTLDFEFGEEAVVQEEEVPLPELPHGEETVASAEAVAQMLSAIGEELEAPELEEIALPPLVESEQAQEPTPAEMAAAPVVEAPLAEEAFEAAFDEPGFEQAFEEVAAPVGEPLAEPFAEVLPELTPSTEDISLPTEEILAATEQPEEAEAFEIELELPEAEPETAEVALEVTGVEPELPEAEFDLGEVGPAIPETVAEAPAAEEPAAEEPAAEEPAAEAELEVLEAKPEAVEAVLEIAEIEPEFPEVEFDLGELEPATPETVAEAPEPTALPIAELPSEEVAETTEAFVPEEAPVAAEEAEPLVAAPASVEHMPRPDTVAIGPLSMSRGLFESYVDEALGRFATLRAELDRLPQTPFLAPSEPAYRAAHTLAGISGTVGFSALQQLARGMEHLIQRLAEAEMSAPDYLDILSEGADGVEAMLGEIVAERMPQPLDELVARIEAASDGIHAELHHHVEAAREAALQPVQPLARVDLLEPQPTEAPEAPEVRLDDDIDEQLLPIFLEESLDLMRDVESESRLWRGNPAAPGPANALARLLHTLKGSSRMAGVMTLGEMVHALESRVEQAVASGAITPAFFDAYDADLDRINHMLDALRSGGLSAAAETPAAPMPAGEVATAAGAAVAPAQEPLEAADAGQQASLRVRANLVDRLVNQAGEMSIARARIEGEMRTLHQSLLDLTENVIRLRKQLREIEIQAETQMQSRQVVTGETRNDFDPLEFDRFTRFQELTRMMAESVNDVGTVQHNLLKNLEQADAALVSQGRINRELAQSLMSVRMVPFNSLASRLHRLVRQTAKELGKKANLEIRGGQAELDRSVLERIAAPLEHLLRNAITHGIEAPAERAARGKPEIGEIALTVAHQGNEVSIAMSDDGAGLDHARIRRRAEELGLLEPGAAVDASVLTTLIFQSGLSTATELSEVAGRGVGMDVVKSETAALGGRIDVNSTEGQGTQFHIYLPLTLAVTHALMVRVGTKTYAIPSAMVEQAREVKPAHLDKVLADGGVDWMGIRYPYHFLARLFGDGHAQPALDLRYTWLLLLKSGTQRIVLHVDELRGNQEIVVKNIGPQLARVVGISGATVLGDGEVVLILNPVALAARELTPAVRKAVEKQAKAHEAKPVSVPTIMVVDDSLTVRKITGRLLEREGYRVVTAKDGVDALEQLLETLPDVMLVDIEMPRMDGFDLSRNIRADARLKHVPIIMITSRMADKHRAYAKEIGVNHYLGKPFQEDELLSLLSSYIHPEVAAESA